MTTKVVTWGGPRRFPLGPLRRLYFALTILGKLILLSLALYGAFHLLLLLSSPELLSLSFLGEWGESQFFIFLGALSLLFLIYAKLAYNRPLSQLGKGVPVVHLFDLLSRELLQLLQKAQLLAEREKTNQLTPELLLLASLHQPETKLFFLRGGLDLAWTERFLKGELPRQEGRFLLLTKEAERIWLESYDSASARGAIHLELPDLLAALLSLPKLRALLDKQGLKEEDIDLLLKWWREEKLYRSPQIPGVWRHLLRPQRNLNIAWTARPIPTLDRFSENLTELARLGFLSKAEVRAEEVKKATLILTRREKNNVVLVGQPGVGKSSIVGGVALEMIRKDAPSSLRDKKLISLSTTRLVAEAPQFGGVVSLLARVVEEASQAGNVVLYIANTHSLATEKEGGIANVTGVLLPALQKNAFQFIGTSNPEEYRAFIENNEELSNFLEKVEVEELDEKRAARVLTYLASLIEKRLGVIITLAAIKKAIELTVKLVHDRVLPDKAEDLLDETAASAINEKKWLVDAELVVRVMETKTKIPLKAAAQEEREKLLHLEARLHERLIDQEEAVVSVSAALRRARAGLAPAKRPIGSFLFVGPTGVGKTELAKSLAAVYFGDEEAMIRLDLTEFKTTESINRLIGAPLGTTEVERGGIFTEAVRGRPFSLILLDELEKAAPNVRELFLQVMDEGRLTDSGGRLISFTNSIIIATSNSGSQFIADNIRRGQGYETIRKNLIDQVLKKDFPPEFLNRFDAIVVFKTLTLAEVRQIAKLQIAQLQERLKKQKIDLLVEEEAIAKLAELGFDPAFGARPLRRVIQEKIENEIARKVLSQEVKEGDRVLIKASAL